MLQTVARRLRRPIAETAGVRDGAASTRARGGPAVLGKQEQDAAPRLWWRRWLLIPRFDAYCNVRPGFLRVEGAPSSALGRRPHRARCPIVEAPCSLVIESRKLLPPLRAAVPQKSGSRGCPLPRPPRGLLGSPSRRIGSQQGDQSASVTFTRPASCGRACGFETAFARGPSREGQKKGKRSGIQRPAVQCRSFAWSLAQQQQLGGGPRPVSACRAMGGLDVGEDRVS
jgi:hypothetical protein